MAEVEDRRRGSEEEVGTLATEIPGGNLPPVTYRDMPEPLPLRRVVGPGVIHPGRVDGRRGVRLVALHGLSGRAGLPVGRGPGAADAVLHKHGGRALRPRHGRDGRYGLHEALAALVGALRLDGDLAGGLAGLGHGGGHDADVRSRGRERRALRHPEPRGQRDRADSLPGGPARSR